jgi:hypothetical protein
LKNNDRLEVLVQPTGFGHREPGGKVKKNVAPSSTAL